MIELGAQFSKRLYYRCSYCGEDLFVASLFDEENEHSRWQYCPYCGRPLYPDVSGENNYTTDWKGEEDG